MSQQYNKMILNALKQREKFVITLRKQKKQEILSKLRLKITETNVDQDSAEILLSLKESLDKNQEILPLLTRLKISINENSQI
jgi:DNA-directed RNA polymerase specialized sigma subunit